MNQLPCPGCQHVYPVPPGLPPQTPFTCQRCGFSSTLGAMLQALQQAAGQAAVAQQGNLDPHRLPGHEPQAPSRPLAQMPQIAPSGLHAGGLDLADEVANPVNHQPVPPQTTPAPGGMAVIQPTRSRTDQYGNPLPPIDVTCPQCKVLSHVPPDTDMNFQFACQKCGHQARLGDVLLTVEADTSAGKKAKPSTSKDFYDDIPEELRQPTELEKIQAAANKKDPRIPAFAAAFALLLLVGVPLFGSGPGEVDPRLAAQGIKPENNMPMKLGIFAGLAVVVFGGVFFLLRSAGADEEDEEEVGS